MSKRILMLSTAAAALFTSAAVADTTITDSKTDPYFTGAKLTSQTGTENAGNITIQSGGAINAKAAQGAVTIDSNHWLLQQGTLTNKDNDSASAIHVDLSANPNYTGTSITGITTGSSTQAATGIYLDGSSNTSVSGSGKTKYGIFLDTSSCSAACTFTGAITAAANSTLSVTGDSSVAIQLGTSSDSTITKYGIIQGNVTINGTVTSAANTSGNNSNTSLSNFGLVSYGQINGDLTIGSTGSMTAYGEGATGMYIGGQGITGALAINGTLMTTILNENSSYNYYSKINTTTNAEAGPALEVLASVSKGIYIGPDATSVSGGAVTAYGQSPAIQIGATSGMVSAITIGTYGDATDPGFSFYNRGTVTAQFTNYNKSATAMVIAGASPTLQTTLSGGFFNSGTLTASAQTSNDASSSTSVAANGLIISGYVRLLPSDGVTGKNPSGVNYPGDQAALVTGGSTGSGKITASVTGTRGGTASAILISSGASVPSLINTGSIAASATTTTASLSGNVANSQGTYVDPLVAVAIEDDSGTLTSIINAGTISATAGYVGSTSSTVSALDNNSQLAIAIRLLGNTTGTTIQNLATTRAATIVGDIYFGGGNNQLLDLVGNANYASTVVGNVYFGSPDLPNNVTASGDRLHIGQNGTLTGKVTTATTVVGSGVEVDVDTRGTLTLLNTDTALNATTVTVATGGTLNLGVNRQLTTGGMIQAQSVVFNTGSNLGVTYASFLPKTAQANGSYQFVLMSSDPGQMQIAQTTLDAFNTTTNRPYLLKTAQMCVTTQTGCTKPTESFFNSHDALLINVTPKTAEEIGLNAQSVALRPITTDKGAATTLFQQANLALAVDDELGAAFLNGVHNAKEAAQAYNDMAPGVTGGTRAIAISITDSATGPVAARQRALRMYGKTSGDFTLWGQEFVQMMKDPGSGAIDTNTGFRTNPGFKDHGFGLALGIDGGSPKYGWYGGAITFYAGDVNELARNAHQNQQWYLMSLYSVWRGKGLFLDAKVDAGYGHIDGKRTLTLTPTSSTYYVRQAENTHAGALISGSIATGAMFSYGAATFMPQLNIDGLYLREEGYTEKNPTTTIACSGGTAVGICDGYMLKVGQYYAKSLRTFLGFDIRYDLKVWDMFLQPEVRAGYRYDFVGDPVKLKAAFAYSDISSTHPAAGDTFEITGPDPSRGNFVLGSTISTTTDTWTLGLNFDLVKGSNDAFQQVGTITIVGRI